MNILLVGNGAREHAIAEVFLKSRHRPKIYAYMQANNPGILMYCEGIEIGSYSSVSKIAEFAQFIRAEFAFIGMDEPLSHGVVDALERAGVPCVGPKKSLAKLETSKSFTRAIMKKYGIEGNPLFGSFTKETFSRAKGFIEEMDAFVVKPDGLTGGKGVWVQGDQFKTKEEGLRYAEQILGSHPAVVIEEKLEGEEFSLQCLTDGKTVLATPPVQDHKRAFDGDLGPNTGGMGSYSDANHLLPFLTKEDVEAGLAITQKMCEALQKETGEYYRGVMYAGLIKTKHGVKLIEYNARFGDPEAMNIMAIFKSDLVDVCRAIVDQKLHTMDLVFEDKATVCKYLVPEGYPTHPVKNERIEVDEDAAAFFYYASVDKKEDGLYMTSSRAVGVVGVASTLEEAEEIAEEGCSHVKGKVFHRKDVGTRMLIQRRIDHMNGILNS